MGEVLIVTAKTDVHADAVIENLKDSKLKPIRLNVEDFIKKSSYNFTWDEQGVPCHQSLLLKDSLRSIDDVKVIWWRKPKDYIEYPEVTDPWAIKYCQDETRSLIQSLPGLFPDAIWINNYYNLRLPSRRINQIPLTRQLKINIPPTLVTNEYEPIKDFLLKHGECIIKPMDYAGFLHSGNQYGCFTRPINIETVESLKDSVHLAPVFIQKRVEKKAEYRVTLIGEKSFVCRIEPRNLDDADVNQDWRVTNPENLDHIQDSLPDAYIAKLQKMLQLLGLHFGAFDIIRDNNDVLNFIELNPNGQWLWIEQLTKMPMIEAMIELIEKLGSNPSLKS
jgi:hypothetical protein